MNTLFAKTVLDWYDTHKRDLPWRHETDPYRIWISEIMLQQTRAETVEKRYAGFLARFPNVFALARAPLDDVLKVWEGLGYYARARNLHRAAVIVAETMNGTLPHTAKELLKLPGMGAYTACSVASIAFDEPVPALDANLARVLCRVTGRREPIASPADLYPVALELIDAQRPGDFNQALMDIGAALCHATQPHCENCCLLPLCTGGQSGSPEDFPARAPKPERRRQPLTVVLALCNGKLFIRRRPNNGLLGGLWEFPILEGHSDGDVICTQLEQAGFASPTLLHTLPRHKHVFTHLVWHMCGTVVSCQSAPEGYIAVDAQGLRAAAMPSALRPYREFAMEMLREG